MNDVVMLGKALADPTRVRILAALLQRELCVCELVDALEVSQSTLSTHLQTLRHAGVLVAARRHKWVDYSLDPNARPAVEAILGHYAQKLKSDSRHQRDATRLNARLAMRVDGHCVLGSSQLDTFQQLKQGDQS